jgi:hypothetical protein
MSEEYDLKKSENKIGQLYPILKSKDGQIIDGFHRQKADPNWKTLVVPEIDTEEKLLAARLIANFHRRQVPREEKEEWINGLATIYKSQGLSASKLIGGKFHNEIKEKLIEATGLTEQTINNYLADDFKAEMKGGGISSIPASDKVEKVLGKKGAEKYRKQILAEAELSPQEKATLTKKRHQEKEERERKREENKGLKEEKLQRQAEETARQKLLKDKDFIADAARLAPLTEEPELQEEPENSQELTSFLTRYAKALKKNPLPNVQKDEMQTAIEFFKRVLIQKKVVCPICGEAHLQWRCGHEF